MILIVLLLLLLSSSSVGVTLVSVAEVVVVVAAAAAVVVVSHVCKIINIINCNRFSQNLNSFVSCNIKITIKFLSFWHVSNNTNNTVLTYCIFDVFFQRLTVLHLENKSLILR
jgi:hypothetical protein